MGCDQSRAKGSSSFAFSPCGVPAGRFECTACPRAPCRREHFIADVEESRERTVANPAASAPASAASKPRGSNSASKAAPIKAPAASVRPCCRCCRIARSGQRELLETASYNDRRLQEENTLFDKLLERTTKSAADFSVTARLTLGSNFINANESATGIAAPEADMRTKTYRCHHPARCATHPAETC